MRKPWYYWLYVRSPIAKVMLGILTVVISFAALVYQGFALEDKRMTAQADNWQGRSVEKGAELFYNNCRPCHGEDGKGLPGVAPALYSRYFFTQRLTDVGYTGTLRDYVGSTVAGGRPSKAVRQWAQMMPTWSNKFGGPLRDDQVRHIVNFVLNWQEDALQQSWDSGAANHDPFQPFLDAPSKAPAGTITYTIGTPASMLSGTVTITGTGGVSGTAAAAAPAGPRTPQFLYVDMGCAGCHKLGPHIAGAVGPDQNELPDVAGTRVAGQDAETYVYTSIVDPNAFVVPNFPAGIMPPNFKDRMSEEEIRGLVKWLLDKNRTY